MGGAAGCLQRLTVKALLGIETQDDLAQSHEPSLVFEALFGFANSCPPALGFANELSVELAQPSRDYSILELLRCANRRATGLEERGGWLELGGTRLPLGDYLTLDGNTGLIQAGRALVVTTIPVALVDGLRRLHGRT